MRVRSSGKALSQFDTDMAVAFAFEGDKAPRGVGDKPLERELARQMKLEGHRGRPTDRLVWNTDTRYPSRRFVVLGLGPEGGPCGTSVRLGCALASKEAARFSARTLGLRMPPANDAIAAQVRAATEGALLGAYHFERYLSDPSRRTTELKSIEVASDGSAATLKQAVSLGQIGGQAVCRARDLVNEAPSRLSPRVMARAARRSAAESKLRCRILGAPEIAKLGLHALLAVARGSAEPPRVVHLTYKPARTAPRGAKRILLVGKGVTFDSGGLNLKPTDGMLTMKMDMGGAAAVLGAMSALAAVGCRVEVHALLGLVENMTGGAAYKPGDILDTHAGKTVEVGNTDAEGRLVLCDLLSHGAARLRPTHVVDVATLTGACVVALGQRATGLFTRHDEMRDALLEAAEAAGERMWPLPMYDDYLALLQKGPADLCNVGGRWGGAITAALFLGEFLDRDLPWAHLDIAGPAFTETDLPEAPVGGTGAAVLTLLRWLEELR